MTPIIKAIQEINSIIPEEILLEGFGKKAHGLRRTLDATNIEYGIREKVIMGRVIDSLNLQSQRIIEIKSGDIAIVQQNSTTCIIKVSKRAMGGCSIVTPLAVTQSTIFGDDGQHSRGTGYNDSTMEGRYQRLQNGHDSIPNVQNADLRLIAPTTVLVENFSFTVSVGLRCTVTHDPELITLPKGYWDEFSSLCCLATEAYLFKTLRFKIAKAKLSGGMELTIFKEVLDEYRDSEKLYKEKLAKFRKYDNLGNAKAKQRATKLQGGHYTN